MPATLAIGLDLLSRGGRMLANPTNWLLFGGVWRDAGVWVDTEIWSD